MDKADVRGFLEEYPEASDDLRTLVEVDGQQDGWTFDDIPLDSGRFGELVSRGIVEKRADTYFLADRSTVESVLDGGSDDADTDSRRHSLDATTPTRPSLSLSFDRVTVLCLLLVLTLTVVLRLSSFGAVFRDGVIVLPGNDPYYYLYWAEELARQAGVGEFSIFTEPLGAVWNREPLLVATLWFLTTLAGGVGAAASVLAWYPVVAAVVTVMLCYRIGIRLFDDTRMGLAAAFVLAITPAHAFRTALGYADHHAFDAVWLAVVLLALVELTVRERDRRWFTDRHTVAYIGVFAVGLTGQLLAWDGSPVVVGVVGLYVAASVVADTVAGRSSLTQHGPLLAGSAVAAVLTAAVHLALGWHTLSLVVVPFVLVAGAVAVVVLAEVVQRQGASPRYVIVGEAAGALVALAILVVLPDGISSTLTQRVTFLFSGGGAVETVSLFAGGFLGPLLWFGFVLFLAIPYLGWLSRAGVRSRPPFLVVAVYGWSFLVLALLQRRFAFVLAFPVSLSAGLGLVHLAAKIDVARMPAVFGESVGAVVRPTLPDARTAGYLFVLLLLVGSLSVVQSPVKIQQATTGDAEYRTAQAIAENIDAHPQTGPTYVLSPWSSNRMYNYFAHGNSIAYLYSLRTYDPFLTATNTTQWYPRLRSQVGYVVTTPVSDAPRDATATRLHDNYGSATDSTNGLGHYRFIHASGDDSVKAFAVVEGATIEGQTDANTTVTLRTNVSAAGESFTYRRVTRTDRTGAFAITVAYPGSYRLGNLTTTVSEQAIRTGQNVSLGGR